QNEAETSFTAPQNAPNAGVYSVAAQLGTVTLVSYEMEAADGWTRDLINDTATSGLWERGDPQSTIAQPEDDHTPGAGVNCWVTGRLRGNGDGGNDVDNGRTTLLSPVMDLSGAAPSVRMSYWRWYSNAAGGAPNQDVFTVQITNDGVNW